MADNVTSAVVALFVMCYFDLDENVSKAETEQTFIVPEQHTCVSATCYWRQ